MTPLQIEFEKTGYASWVNDETYPHGKVYTDAYVKWLEKKAKAAPGLLEALQLAYEEINHPLNVTPRTNLVKKIEKTINKSLQP